MNEWRVRIEYYTNNNVNYIKFAKWHTNYEYIYGI